MLKLQRSFKLLDILKKYFNQEADVRVFVSEFEEVMENKISLKMDGFATKKDMVEMHSLLKLEIAELRTEMRRDISDLRSDFTKLEARIDLSLVNTTLVIEKSQKEQLKWLIGSMIAIMGLAVTMMKLF